MLQKKKMVTFFATEIRKRIKSASSAGIYIRFIATVVSRGQPMQSCNKTLKA